MDYHLHEILELSAILEAEAGGKPFDRSRAHKLAATLAADLPQIGNTMRMMTERLGAPSVAA